MTTGCRFTRFRWVCTVLGLLFSVADIASDLLLCVQYFLAGYGTWFALTLLFILTGSLCCQTFSYVWYMDDSDSNNRDLTCRCKIRLVLVHLLQMGFFKRYYELLKKSFRTVWQNESSQNQTELFGLATDLSMLRLFETFLESVPQLLLQLYIMLEHQHRSTLQYISMVVSFLNIAWTTVDFWRCFRRSLPGISEIPGGIPTIVYLLYKILTISARILSLSLLILLSPFSVVAFAFIWLVGFVWAHVVKTSFCTSRHLEEVYRAVIGFILIFTFFNVKGQGTKRVMSVYYVLTTLQNLSAPILLFLFKPCEEQTDFFLPMTAVILIANTLGLQLLILYYGLLHPQKTRVPDEVDGPRPTTEVNTTKRREDFLRV
ncbi:XK-related protein 9 [Brachyhypopomus gauderio]|uniref:XK-related protein 9 n=1 Tax=Brachyhypopomus gauderio TaxID=698409 RepID=UPI004042E09E